MPARNDHPDEKPTAGGEYNELLCRRMAILGLNAHAVASTERETFKKITQHCIRCSFREACATDLKCDPSNQIWEAYCPNSEALYTLTALTEQGVIK